MTSKAKAFKASLDEWYKYKARFNRMLSKGEISEEDYLSKLRAKAAEIDL